MTKLKRKSHRQELLTETDSVLMTVVANEHDIAGVIYL